MKKDQLFHTAVYIRLSKEDGDKIESDSIVNQKKLIAEYIKGKDDFVIYDIYIDDGYTGTNFNRPAFRKMITDIETGSVNCVIVKDLSRFGRDYIDAGRYLERYFPEHNVRFISITDHIDSLNQTYDMLLPIKNIFNEQYARDISGKVHASLTTKQKAGEFIGAFASYGYKKSPINKNKLIIDEYAARIVRRIFRLYIEGYGKIRIAGILNAENIPCPSEYKKLNGENYRNSNCSNNVCHWTYSTINHILYNEMYIGNMVQGKTHQYMHGRAKPQDKENWHIIKGTHEPVIDHDTWLKAQTLLKRRTRTSNPETNKKSDTKAGASINIPIDAKSNVNIFAGFIKCGDCGKALCKKTSNGKIHYYCGTYVRSGSKYCTPHAISYTVLEDIVLRDLRTVLQNIDDLPDIMAKQASSFNSLKNQTMQSLNPLYDELQKIRKLKKEVYEDYKEHLISKNEYISYHQDYINKEALLTGQLEEIKAASRNTSSDSFETLWIKQMTELRKIRNLTRPIIVEMIQEIKIYENNRIAIIYHYSNDSGPLPD